MHGVGISRKNIKKNLKSNYKELWEYLAYNSLQGNNATLVSLFPCKLFSEKGVRFDGSSGNTYLLAR